MIIINASTVSTTALFSLLYAYVIAISCAWQFNAYRQQGFQAIVKREKAEEALKQSEERFRSLVESTSDWIWQVDRNGVYTYASPKVTEILGFQPPEVLGKTPFDLMPKQEAENIGKRFEEISKDKKSFFGLENWNISKNGKLVLLETSGVPILDQDGNLVGYRGIDRDITERKKAEQELVQSRVKLEEYATNLQGLVELRTKQLQNSERLAAIGQTAGMVGHDIRNPLQAITSDLYLVKTELASTSESEEKKNVLESLDEIENNVMYINKIVADLQDYARPLTPENKNTNLQKLIADLIRETFIPKNVRVDVNVQKEMASIVSDSDLLRRVLANLISNGVQAMPNGGRLSIKAYREAECNVITIEDTGIGIPEEVKAKVFTPLFTTKSKGQGLGLAVVKRLTESLGGTVTFESEMGKGTRFILAARLE